MKLIIAVILVQIVDIWGGGDNKQYEQSLIN